MSREKTAAAIERARDEWLKAPVHIRMMAGAYVSPLLDALMALNDEMASLKDDLIKGVL